MTLPAATTNIAVYLISNAISEATARGTAISLLFNLRCYKQFHTYVMLLLFKKQL
ncbi:hypothetical protein [Mucilaginibacter flavus]|uniref:hypothetical protein n=1 Tax=Mucilaginibacter flavus TaxID=931504 RepID=UPI0025B3CB14|nr:hypothetical protein [Mucilaginibacter flavus]